MKVCLVTFPGYPNETEFIFNVRSSDEAWNKLDEKVRQGTPIIMYWKENDKRKYFYYKDTNGKYRELE